MSTLKATRAGAARSRSSTEGTPQEPGSGKRSSTGASAPRSERSTNAQKAAAAEDAFEAEAPRRVRRRRAELAGHSVAATTPGEPLTPGDDRTYSDIDTLVSDQNLVTPLFPNILVDPDGPESYEQSMMQAIREAQKLIVIEGYDLNREDLVDLLIQKAKEGVEVAALFDPVNTPREVKKGELLERLRAANLPNLHVAEYAIVPSTRKDGFDQILHTKKVITDTPDGSICEHSGGINFSPNSTKNIDFGWRTEGLAVIDSLRHVIAHWTSTTGEFPIDLTKVPDWNDVRSLAAKKARASKKLSAEVEMASSGTRPMETPRTYSKRKLVERAQLGQKIIVSAEDAMKPGVEKTLRMAVHNGSKVWVIEGEMSEADLERFATAKKALKDAGIQVFRHDDVLVEESYLALVSRELDAAIENREPIEVAAFALTHAEILDRLIAAHDAGCEVRVVVDDLEIDGNLINKKALAQLSAAGVPIRAVDADVKEEMARDWAGDESQLKLHAKYIGIGQNRILAGSANFSENGMSNNVEDGRLVRSEAVAQSVSERMFEPLWERAKPVEPFSLVSDEKRVPLLPRVPVDTPVDELVFVVMDFETTGFVAKYDDRILQMSARAVRVDKQGSVEVLGDFDQVVTPGTNLLGQPFAIPKRVANLIGLDPETLEARGAIPMREAMPDLVRFIQEQTKHGKVVLAGQNLPFDLRFFDHTMSREALGIQAKEGVVHPTVDGPYVDCIDLSERVFPDETSHNLDAHIERLGIEVTEDLPRHDAFADVVYTAEALGRLMAELEPETLGDLLPPDLIELEKPTKVYASPRKGASAPHELSLNDSGKLQIQVRDPRSGQLGGARRVYDLQVVGRENSRLEVEITTGRGDKAETLYGFIDDGGLSFRSGGRFYHALREEGRDLPKPRVVTP